MSSSSSRGTTGLSVSQQRAGHHHDNKQKPAPFIQCLLRDVWGSSPLSKSRCARAQSGSSLLASPFGRRHTRLERGRSRGCGQ